MESVKSARARLGRYPALLASCAPQVKLLLLLNLLLLKLLLLKLLLISLSSSKLLPTFKGRCRQQSVDFSVV